MGLHLQSFLFYETPEEIFARVWREVKPRTPVPVLEVHWRKYANANSRVELKDGRLLVMLPDLLQGAPGTVLEALAWILLSKLFRRTPPAHFVHHYRRFLNRKDMRHTLHQVRRQRGRKHISGSQGEVYDLEPMFESLNQQYFHGLMARPQLGWSRTASRTLLGHYDPSHNAIILSRILDRENVPVMAVEYVLYHEMLHLRFPVEYRGARRCVHSAEFRAAEKEFARWKEAKEALKHL